LPGRITIDAGSLLCRIRADDVKVLARIAPTRRFGRLCRPLRAISRPAGPAEPGGCVLVSPWVSGDRLRLSPR
jgi:hypothetical protein